MADAPKINPNESLRTSYPKLNQAIENSNQAKRESEQAVNTSNQSNQIANDAKQSADSTRTELNAVVNRETDSDAMSRQAAVDETGYDHVNLKSRLDNSFNSVNSQLAQIEDNKADQGVVNLKADIDYVDTRITELGRVEVSGVYNTLADLQNALPNGGEGIYVVYDTGHWYYWGESVWVDGGVFQSSGLGEGSVTPTHLQYNGATKNKGTIYPLKNVIRNGELHPYTFRIEDIFLDVKVIGAKRGKLYQIEWIGNGYVREGTPLYTFGIREFDKDTFATDSGLGYQYVSFTNLEFNFPPPTQDVETRILEFDDIIFIITVDYTGFGSSDFVSLGSSARGCIIDPNCYVYLPDKKIEEQQSKIETLNFERKLLEERNASLEKYNEFAWKDFDKAYAIINIDDGNPDLSTIYSIFQEYNAPLSAALPPDMLGNVMDDGSTLLDLAKRIKASGGEILGHGGWRERITEETTEEEANEYLREAKRILSEEGLTVNGYVKVGGTGALDTLGKFEHIVRKYYRYGFSIGDNPPYNTSRIWLNNTTDNLKVQIDNAIANKELIVFYGHTIGDSSEPNLTETSLRWVVEYVSNTIGVELVTMKHLYERFGTTKNEIRLTRLESLVS